MGWRARRGAGRATTWAFAVGACAAPGDGTSAAQDVSPHLSFVAEAPEFEEATVEYRRIWAEDGARVVDALERGFGMPFPVDRVSVTVREAPSFAGRDRIGMRASYPFDTKRATLAHELGHILVADRVRDEPRDGRAPPDPHFVLFLFLYDAWVELWGPEFADQEVAVESARRGRVDYEGIWREALSLTAAERAAELERILREWGPGH